MTLHNEAEHVTCGMVVAGDFQLHPSIRGSFCFISATSVDFLPKVSYGTLSKFRDDKKSHTLTCFKIVLKGVTRVRIYQYEFQISVHFVRERTTTDRTNVKLQYCRIFES